jgi:hypothetical protein
MKDLTILIGAGFSRNCGFPLSCHIDDKLSNLDIENLLHFGSGEWKWDEHGEPDSTNGRHTSDGLGLSLLLQKYIMKYIETIKKPFDYEEFLDWFIEISINKSLVQEMIGSVNLIIKEKYNFPEKDFHYLDSSQTNLNLNQVYDCYNELIADLLYRQYDSENKFIDYFDFLCFFLMFDKINIFTLNHDLLLESLLENYKKAYSDGFSIINSPLRGDDDEPIEIYQNIYSNKIRIFKLHGSINYYRYDLFDQNKTFYNPTGGYYFFKPKTYHNKHIAKRIDLKTGQTIQEITSNITPQFLTGKDKVKIIQRSSYYADGFQNFKTILNETTDLMTIGYSFRDTHINDMLEVATKGEKLKVVYNINKSKYDFFTQAGYKGYLFYYDDISNFN